MRSLGVGRRLDGVRVPLELDRVVTDDVPLGLLGHELVERVADDGIGVQAVARDREGVLLGEDLAERRPTDRAEAARVLVRGVWRVRADDVPASYPAQALARRRRARWRPPCGIACSGTCPSWTGSRSIRTRQPRNNSSLESWCPPNVSCLRCVRKVYIGSEHMNSHDHARRQDDTSTSGASMYYRDLAGYDAAREAARELDRRFLHTWGAIPVYRARDELSRPRRRGALRFHTCGGARAPHRRCVSATPCGFRVTNQ